VFSCRFVATACPSELLYFATACTGSLHSYSKSQLTSRVQRFLPSPTSYMTFLNTLLFYGEELLTPCHTPQLDDHPLSGASVYSLLHSIPLGHLLKLHWKTRHAVLASKKLDGLSPRANYTDRAIASCRRSDCQLLRIEGATWSA
jgi:hypothetical protein